MAQAPVGRGIDHHVNPTVRQVARGATAGLLSYEAKPAQLLVSFADLCLSWIVLASHVQDGAEEAIPECVTGIGEVVDQS